MHEDKKYQALSRTENDIIIIFCVLRQENKSHLRLIIYSRLSLSSMSFFLL